VNNFPAPRPIRLQPAIKGIGFVRLAIAMALGGDDPEVAAKIARKKWGEDAGPTTILKAGGPTELLLQKAEIPAGSTVSGTWAEPLTLFEGAAVEFFALVREASLIGRLPGLRRVPLRTRLVSAATGINAAWVGEGSAVPMGSATYGEDNIEPRKVAALAVITEELASSSDPSAEITIRNDMVAAIAEAIDATFIDPANAGTPGIKPASVTNGAPSIGASGDGAADIRELIAGFPGDLERAILVGSPATFAVLSDPFLFPRLGVRGGEALGIPAVPSKAAGATLALIDPSGIAFGEAEMNLRTSRQASVEMLDNPTNSGVEPTATTLVSLWQTNSIGILVEKTIAWEVPRPSLTVLTGMAPS
jgi:hypothetical protein